MSFLYAVLLALAQSQPSNVHDTEHKDRAVGETSNAQVERAETGNSNSTLNKDQTHPSTKPDLDAAEKDNPHHAMSKDKDKMSMSSGSDLMMQLHAANLEEIDAG